MLNIPINPDRLA